MRFNTNVWISILALTAISGPVVSQQIRETPIGRHGIKLIEVLNSNQKDSQLNFITTRLDSRALEEGAAAWLKKFVDLYTLTGGVTLTDIQPGRDPDEVRMTVKSNSNGKIIDIITHLSRESPDKLIGFMYRVQPNTSSVASLEKPLTEPAVIDEIDKRLAQAVKEDKFSGVVLITKNDHLLTNKAYGFADKQNNIYNTPDTKFNVGSMNKMFTGVAIAQLVQAGKLSFNDTLATLLPHYPNNVAATITVHQLLTHTSGLGNFFTPEFFEHRENYINLNSYLPLFASEPLLFEPGKGWHYSNAGFIVLGLVIEKVSGENYFDYVRNHICKPAGMNDTDFYERNMHVPNLALGYAYDEADKQHALPRVVNTKLLPVKGSSAGGGYSTAADLLLFSKALFEYRLLNKDFTKLVVGGKVNDGRPDSSYGYGFINMTRNSKHIIGHNGGGPGISACMNMLPDNGYTVILLGNYSAPSADKLAAEISDFLITQ